MTKVRRKKRSKAKPEKIQKEEPVILIKAVKQSIDWSKLTNEQRYNLFLRELGEQVYQRRGFIQTLKNISDLFEKENKNKTYQSILRAETGIGGIKFLMNEGRFVPITNDVILTIEGGRARERSKEISIEEFQEKINNVGYVGNMVDALKQYDNIPDDTSYTFRSDLTRYGTRALGNPNTRTIIDNETITVSGFNINFNLRPTELLFVDMTGAWNWVRNFTRQNDPDKPLKAKPIAYTNDLKEKSVQLQMMQWFQFLEARREMLSRNTFKFDTEILNAFIDKDKALRSLKQIVPGEMMELRERLVPNKILENDEIIGVYGKYPVFDKLADLGIQRELYLSSSWLMSLPAQWLILELKKNNVHQQVFDTAVRLINHRIRVSRDLKMIKSTEDLIQRNYDIYSQAIYEQLSPKILDELQTRARDEYKTLYSLLTDKQLKIIEKYIAGSQKKRTEYLENKCPHFALRQTYEQEIDIKKRYNAFQKMITDFGKNPPDQETRFLFCSNCGFNMGCMHELLLLEEFVNPNKREKVQEDLEQNYYTITPSSIDCKYCGRKIGDPEISAEEAYDEDGFKIVGIVIEREDNDTISIRSLARQVLVQTSLQGIFNYYQLANNVSGYLLDKWASIEGMGLNTEETQLLKQMHGYAYIYGKIIDDLLKKPSMKIRKKYRPESKNPDYKDYFISAIRLDKDFNPEFYTKLNNRGWIKRYLQALNQAYKTIHGSGIKKDKSLFTMAQKIWGYDFNPMPTKDPYKSKMPTKIPEKLIDVFERRMWDRKKLIGLPFNDPKWIENNNMFDNEKLNKEYDLFINFNLPLGYNRRLLPDVPLKWLGISQTLPDKLSAGDYTSTGAKRNYSELKLIGPEGGKYSASQVSSILKRQKELYNSNFDIQTLSNNSYYLISNQNNINVGTINLYSRELLSDGKTKKQWSSGTPVKFETILEYDRIQEIYTLITNACSGLLGQRYFWGGVEIICSPKPPSLDLARKVSKGLGKEPPLTGEVPQMEVPVISEPKGINTILDIEKIEETARLLKLKSINQLVNLGTFTKLFNYQYTTIDKSNKDAVKSLRHQQAVSRMTFIKDALRKLQTYLTTRAPSPKIDKRFTIFYYEKIIATKEISSKSKINALLNIHTTLLYDNYQSADIIKKYLAEIEYDTELTDITPYGLLEIENDLDLQRRRRTEIYLKMTPDEKTALGFSDLGLEEQIELLHEQEKEKSTIEDDTTIKSYKQEEQKDVYSQTLDDEQGMDDDIALYQTGSFEVY